MNIRRLSGLSNRGIGEIVIEAIHELNSLGYSEDAIGVHYTDKAVVSYHEDKPVAFISYMLRPDENYLFIKLAYVKKEFRQSSRYHYMLEDIYRIALEEKCGKVMAVIHPDNHLSRMIAESYKFVATAITYELDLKPKQKASAALPLSQTEFLAR